VLCPNRLNSLSDKGLGRAGRGGIALSPYATRVYDYLDSFLFLSSDSLDIVPINSIMVAQERMVVLLWTLDQKRSPRAGMGVMIPRYSGSIPVFPAFLFIT
jgi:hypothetical protein